MGNEVTYTILRNNYEVTICCEVMGDLLIVGRVEPVELSYEGEDTVHSALELLGDEYTCIVNAFYCPNCGTKVQLKEVKQCPG